MCFNQMASKLSKCDSTRQSEMFLNVILDVFKCVKDIHLRCLSLLSLCGRKTMKQMQYRFAINFGTLSAMNMINEYSSNRTHKI